MHSVPNIFSELEQLLNSQLNDASSVLVWASSCNVLELNKNTSQKFSCSFISSLAAEILGTDSRQLIVLFETDLVRTRHVNRR